MINPPEGWGPTGGPTWIFWILLIGGLALTVFANKMGWFN